MSRFAAVAIATSLVTLAGCSWRNPPPEPARRVTPGARILYNSGVGDAIWSICDKGNIIYMTEKSADITVVPGGCPSGQP